MKQFICAYCNKEFFDYEWNKKHKKTYCSVTCYHNDRKPFIEQRICICGKPLPFRKQRKYCSKQCYIQSQRMNPCSTCFVETVALDLDKKLLKSLYCDRKLGIYEIAERFNISYNTVFHRLKKYGIPRRTNSESTKLMWSDPEFAEKTRIAIIKGLCKRPTNLEKKLMKTIEQHHLPFRYVGAGDLLIGLRCPDFINEDTKQVIEVFGSYWHDPNVNEKVRPNQTYDLTMKHYEKFDFDCLILWDYELNDEDLILDKIGEFIHG